jgi:K+-sensing histidine kinase KdpD
MIAHDLRGPLALITGYADLLLESSWEPLTEAQAERTTVIRDSAQRAADLIAILCDSFKLVEERLTLDAAPTRIQSVVRQAADAVKGYLASRQALLQIINHDESQVVMIDQLRFQSALSLLLRFMAQQSPSCSTFQLIVSSPSSETETFSLTGRVRLPETTRRSETAEPGARPISLALFVAQTVVGAHGGRLDWYGVDVSGEAFRMELPVGRNSVPPPYSDEP